MEKQSSVLDYVRPGLDPAVFGADGFLLPEHHKQITETLAKFLADSGFKAADSWITDVKLVGSLTTYQYTSATDVDIHVPVDLAAFIKTENPYLTEQDANDLLDALRKKFNPEKTPLSNTSHPLELYFETPLNRKTQPPRTGSYSLLTNEWTLPPISIDVDFDMEDINPMLIDLAEELASELDVDLGKLKRDVLRAEELVDVINSWEPDKQTKFKQKLDERLLKIEQEINALILKKDEIADARKNYDPESEQEIKFKYVQRFGYFAIISALKELVKDDGKVTEDELPVIEKILDKEAAKKPRVTPIEDITVGGKTVKIVVDSSILDSYLNSVKLSLRNPENFDFDNARSASHDDALESALQLTDFKGEDPYLYAAHVRDAISRFAEDMFNEKYGALNKTAGVHMWLDPNGKEYSTQNYTHSDWIYKNKDMLHQKYGLVYDGSPMALYKEMLMSGWTRVTDDHGDLGLQVGSLNKIPAYLDDFILDKEPNISMEEYDGGFLLELTNPYPSLQEAVKKELRRARIPKAAELEYTAEFTPSMSAMPPNSVGPDNVVTPLDPDTISDEETLTSPTVDKPRNRGGFWRTLIDWFIKRKENKEAAVSPSVRNQARALWQQRVEEWESKVHPIELFVMNEGGISSYKPSSETGKKEEREEYRGIPVRLRGIVSYDDMIDRLKSNHLLDHDAPYGELYDILSHLPNRGERPTLQDAIYELEHPEEFQEQEMAATKEAAFELQYWIDPNGHEYEGEALKQEGVTPEKLIRQGWVQVLVPSDRQGVVLVVDELEFTPDHLNAFLAKTVGYGDPVTVKDTKGSTITLRYPFKNIRGLIKKQLYAPDQEMAAKLAGYGGTQSFWISPDGEVHDASPSHADWALENQDFLLENYHIDLGEAQSIDEDIGLQEMDSAQINALHAAIMDILIGAGWVRVFIHGKEMVVQISDFSNVPSSPNDFFAAEQANYDNIMVSDYSGETVSLPETTETFHDAVLNELKLSHTKASLSKTAGVARCWISPTGKVYPVKDTHSEWMEQNQTILKRDYNLRMEDIMKDYYDEDTDSYSASSVDMSNQLVAQGWTRIGDIFNALDIGVQVPSLHDINTSVFDYLISSIPDKSKIMIEDLDENFVDVTKEDLLEGQEGVNRAMQIGHARKAANLKFASSGRYWIDPTGKVYNVPGTHTAWVGRNAEKLNAKFGYNLPLGVKHGHEYTDTLIDNGWVRIADDQFGTAQFVVDVKDLASIPDTVDSFIAEHFTQHNKLPLVVGTRYGKLLRIFEPFPSLQEAVNEELKFNKHYSSLLTASASSEILKLINETGGASYNLQGGNLAGTAMYAVSTHPERSVILDHLPTEAEIDSYLNQNKDILNGENSFGAWFNKADGKTYLDVVTTLSDRDKAIELGKKHNQIAIFDLKNFVEIPTGGTGEVPKQSDYKQQSLTTFHKWLSPNGEVFQDWNDQFVFKHMDKFLPAGFQKPKFSNWKDQWAFTHKLMQTALDQGWVRLSNIRGDVQITADSQETAKLANSFIQQNAEHIKSVTLVVGGKTVSQESISDFLQSIGDTKWLDDRYAEKESAYGPEDGHPKEYYTHNTDDKNLGNPNQRFMGRPKGPNRSNQEEVIQMIFEKPLSSRQAELEVKSFTINGFWVAPDGKAFDVRSSGSRTHGDWVMKNANILAKYGIKDAKKRDYFEVATEMLQKGWARVGDSARNKFATIGVEVNDIKAIPSGVEDVLATFLQDGDNVIVADLSGNWGEVTYPFKSLQNAVRRAVRGELTADYTQDQQDAIFVEQHEFTDNTGLATTPHDFTNSSSDYPSPKDLQPVQVFLDKLDKRKTPPIPSYEVSWAISQPKE